MKLQEALKVINKDAKKEKKASIAKEYKDSNKEITKLPNSSVASLKAEIKNSFMHEKPTNTNDEAHAFLYKYYNAEKPDAKVTEQAKKILMMIKSEGQDELDSFAKKSKKLAKQKRKQK